MSGGGMSIGSGGRGMSAGAGCSIMRRHVATTLPTAVRRLYSDVLVPQLRTRTNEIGHEADACDVLKNFNRHTS